MRSVIYPAGPGKEGKSFPVKKNHVKDRAGKSEAQEKEQHIIPTVFNLEKSLFYAFKCL